MSELLLLVEVLLVLRRIGAVAALPPLGACRLIPLRGLAIGVTWSSVGLCAAAAMPALLRPPWLLGPLRERGDSSWRSSKLSQDSEDRPEEDPREAGLCPRIPPLRALPLLPCIGGLLLELLSRLMAVLDTWSLLYLLDVPWVW